MLRLVRGRGCCTLQTLRPSVMPTALHTMATLAPAHNQLTFEGHTLHTRPAWPSNTPVPHAVPTSAAQVLHPGCACPPSGHACAPHGQMPGPSLHLPCMRFPPQLLRCKTPVTPHWQRTADPLKHPASSIYAVFGLTTPELACEQPTGHRVPSTFPSISEAGEAALCSGSSPLTLWHLAPVLATCPLQSKCQHQSGVRLLHLIPKP